jgi:peptidoglycan/LPS O-acetylase OafA/YrhL
MYENGVVDVQKGSSRGGGAGTLARRRDPDVPVSAIPVTDDNGSHPDDPVVIPDSPRTARGDTRLRYLPGLDGLRAVSVLAVLAYHYRPDNSLLRGGFLGVEVFFVISGYLITSLLLTERRRRGRVSLRAFWVRRARRLAPALAALILGTGLFVALFHHDELHSMRGDLVFGFWGQNWWSIFHHALYSEQYLRQPLQHLWSLAVEEQFYLVWPLVFIAGMAWLGRRRMAYAVAALAAASWIGSIVWLHTSVQSAGDLNNTLYVSTITRAYGLLLGALAAFLAGPERFRGKYAPSAPRALNSIGALALVLLAVQMHFATQTSHSLYYFGLLLTDVLTLAIIVAIVHPASRWNRLLGVRPLRAIGLRSYGIYLWGVVVLEFTRPGIDVHWNPVTLFVVRLVVIAALVEFSYRYIEMPVRRGALSKAWRDLQGSEGTRHEALAFRWMVAAATIIVLVVPLAVLASLASPSKAVDGGQVAAGGGDKTLQNLQHGGALPSVPITTPTTAPTTAKGGQGEDGPSPTTVPHGKTSPGPKNATFTGYPQVWSSGYIVSAVGDSVMLGADLKPKLPLETGLKHVVGPGVWVNAAVSRQEPVCVDFLKALNEHHQLGPVVIVHCGNNGYLSNHFVSDVMQLAGPKRHVVFMTDKVEVRPWQDPNNQLITSQARNYPNAKVLDWHYFGTHIDQNTYFVPEFNGTLHMHLTQPAGAQFYTNLIIDTLRNWGWLPRTAA